MVAALAAAGLGTGCRALVELVETETSEADATASDHDSGQLVIDAGCAPWSYTPEHFDPCEIPQPTGVLTLTPGVWSYDTNSGALIDPDADARFPTSVLLTQVGGPQARLVFAGAIIVESGAELRVQGGRPLILASWSTIAVEGTIDVSSRAADAGPGADPTFCPSSLAGQDNANGAGGGGGGGFGGAGAEGGIGEDGVAAAGAGGAAAAVPVIVRGGCMGGSGGNVLGGAGGSGGGALQLTARDSIVVGGVLHAGGAGGGASAGGRSGGGGGGSGGMLGMQAPSVSITGSAVVAANGGGGGGGSDNDPAGPGQDGLADAVAALGGDGQGQGDDGGPGGFAGAPAAPGLASSRGGGGGGGGVGYVLLWAATVNLDGAAVISPAMLEP